MLKSPLQLRTSTCRGVSTEAMGTSLTLFGQLMIGLLVVGIATAVTDTIRIGYFMANDPYRAAAINLAIATAQDDGMLNQYNFRYNSAVWISCNVFCFDYSHKL